MTLTCQECGSIVGEIPSLMSPMPNTTHECIPLTSDNFTFAADVLKSCGGIRLVASGNPRTRDGFWVTMQVFITNEEAKRWGGKK